MRRVFPFALILTLAVLVLLLVGCQPGEETDLGEAPAEETAPSALSDEDAIRKLAQDFTLAWDAGDASKVAAFWSLDGDYVNPQGEMIKGREAIEAAFDSAFQGRYKDTKLRVETTSIRFLQPDVALADGSYQVTGIKDGEGNELPSVKGLYTSINVKKDGKWLIVSHRPMIPVTPSGTT